METITRSRARGQARRFVRATTRVRMEITERDRAIIAYVHQHRLLRSTHIAKLLGEGNLRYLQRRLAALFDHGYLERPRTQMAYDRFTPGTSPVVYALGPQARRLLPEAIADPNLSAERLNQKNKLLRPIFYEHTLMVADVMVAVQAACRGRDDVVFVPFEKILAAAPPKARSAARPNRLTVRVRHEGQMLDLASVPDAIFGLHFPKGRGPGRADTLYFFVEADRGTERLRADLSTSRHTNFYQKMVSYFEVFKQKRHEELLGLTNFRVLTITTSGKRVDNLIAVNKKLNEGKGTRLFFFTDHQAVLDAPNILELAWRNGADDKLATLPD